MSKATVIVRLTPKQADLVWRNADGWIDAGSCEGGLEKEEKEALDSLCDQISQQIHKSQRKAARRRVAA